MRVAIADFAPMPPYGDGRMRDVEASHFLRRVCTPVSQFFLWEELRGAARHTHPRGDVSRRRANGGRL